MSNDERPRLTMGSANQVEMRKIVIDQVEQMRVHGWIEALESHVDLVDRLFDGPDPSQLRHRTLEELRPKLLTEPTSLIGTLFESAHSDGVRAAGYLMDGRFTGLCRLLVHPELGRLAFIEDEPVLRGTRLKIGDEDLWPRLNDMPLVYAVWKARSGRAQTNFFWFRQRKDYQLYIAKAVLKDEPTYERVMRELVEVLA